jgi:hypothetical protein
MTMLFSVGLTKNPLQPISRAKIASTPTAPVSRSLCFVDDIVVELPRAAAIFLKLRFVRHGLQKL